MEPVMKVADILQIKGSVVKTVPPHQTALLLSGQLRADQIGATVVSSDGNSVDGIASERDIAYGLATYGGRLPTTHVSELMTKSVIVCSPQDSVSDVLKLMTMRHIRHVPVKDGDQLVGIISIGDILKQRLGELQVGADLLHAASLVI
jgi:CBS domain-containing protein